MVIEQANGVVTAEKSVEAIIVDLASLQGVVTLRKHLELLLRQPERQAVVVDEKNFAHRGDFHSPGSGGAGDQI